MRKCLFIFLLVVLWNCGEVDPRTQNLEVVGIWDISDFTIDNISIKLNNNIMLPINDSTSHLMDGTDWNFQGNGDIILDVVTWFFPDGTGDKMVGKWETSNDSIQIIFDEENISIINDSTGAVNFYTVTYFNNLYFQYEISEGNMMLTSGDTTILYKEK